MADSENTVSIQSGFECEQDNGLWICTDPDTGRTEIGETRSESIRLLRATLSRLAQLSRTKVSAISEAPLGELVSNEAVNVAAVFREERALYARILRKKKSAPDEYYQSRFYWRNRRTDRLKFRRILNVHGLPAALQLCKSDMAARDTLAGIVIILLYSHMNYLEGARWAENISKRGEIIAHLKGAISLMNSHLVVADPEQDKIDKSALVDMVVRFEESNQSFEYVLQNGISFSVARFHRNPKGAALTHPEGARKAAIGRALDSCLPAEYGPSNGFYRFALIANLMMAAGYDVTPQQVRRAIHS